MTWIFAGVALALAGLVVLGFLGVRVLRAAAGLGREVDEARRKLEPAQRLFTETTRTIRASRG
ncbi:threonine/homoserine/homoserine lactone efflux protein [Streptosporangium becharense]|uniref:Threonine/homoserine/homoserine lactone efflux protein n=1 Tax=Streptosporangium becharense TaxID=1816182 RepID=A0A7W9MET9_9ACTN|nr:hypothetical protein [Streptosporangium becharense]MBB2913730.1 threonine/homoserine/homoserine lactone efflux protein [Streptosporangium becharense]MBB5817811.1 threonine/homoserine/homoserine lactone efflux protein [Streptosporangium becharense]